ncbi:MAG: metalloregulator ArsR/SmtB family transcription factor, partial [Bacteroidales bacterium]|nr:metalloregulator ArsR/SmtB family transcription factor [Bacteroidales bacterium]
SYIYLNIQNYDYYHYFKIIYLYICICLINHNSFKKMQIKDLTIEQLEEAANMLKAIAHPMRIAILNYLEDGKKLTVTEIHELLKIEQSTTSHHLGILKDKGVLSSKRDGKNTYYFLKHANLSNIVNCVSKCTMG